MTAQTLPTLPATFGDTRDALHQLSYFVLAPRRYDCAGRLGLRATSGGFGTPWYPTGAGPERVRVDAGRLVVEGSAGTRQVEPTTVLDACRHVGIDYRETWFEDFHDPLAAWQPDRDLPVDEHAATVLGTWFAFGTEALGSLAGAPGAVDASAIQLWPEHFDPACEVGPADVGQRASYGASAGDAGHDQPYLYVVPWGDHGDEPYWNDPVFGGASLGYDELRTAADPLLRAVEFLWRGLALLTRDGADEDTDVA